MTVTSINVEDMHCANCSNRITRALADKQEIEHISVNPIKRRLFVTHAPSLSSAQVIADIEDLGFTPVLHHHSTGSVSHDRYLLRRLGVAGICAMQVMMLHIALYSGEFQGMSSPMERLLTFAALAFCIPIISYAAIPFFRSGFAFLVSARPINMDTPIAIALTIAFCTSVPATFLGQGNVYYDSVAMFTFLMLGARYLDQRLRAKLDVEDSLQAMLPKSVTRLNDNQEEVVPLAAVRPGDVLAIAEGEQIPADGTLVSTQAQLNTALISGESSPGRISMGEPIYAGSINTGPAIELEITAVSSATRIAAIDRIADLASIEKLNATRTADAVAKVFVPSILLIAGMTYLLWYSGIWAWQNTILPIEAALAVLVVSCPCALSLAAPAAISAALVALRKRGLLVRNSQAIERAAEVDTAIFDKTGTLTNPHARITDIDVRGAFSDQECLHLAAVLQRHSSHPLARAFRPFDLDRGNKATQVAIETGGGVRGTVDGYSVTVGSAHFCRCPSQPEDSGKHVYLTVNGELAAVFTLEQVLRHDAYEAVNTLRGAGLQVQIASGDNLDNCAEVGNELGIEYQNDMSPESKSELARRGSVLFVGDGINDLAALANADVSISTLETVDVVKSRADVLLTSNRLANVVKLITISRRTKQIIRQNLVWALIYNSIAIPLAAGGLATPWLAALGMSASSIIVMLNATRILNQET